MTNVVNDSHLVELIISSRRRLVHFHTSHRRLLLIGCHLECRASERLVQLPTEYRAFRRRRRRRRHH
jgi:hypothetical protein